MKKVIVAAAVAAVALVASSAADAQSRHRHRGGGGTTVIQPGIDPATLLLLGTLGSGGGASPLAALALSGVLAGPTIIDSGRRGRRR